MEKIEQQIPVEEQIESQEVVNSVADIPDYSTKSLKEITEIFEQMLERADQQELSKYADILKAAFYKVLKKEKIAAGVFEAAPGEQPSEPAQPVVNPYIAIERGFKEMYAAYKESKAQYQRAQERLKEENLAKKLQIIDELKALIESKEDLNSTFPAFRELQNRWREITLVPQAKAKDLWESYQHQVEQFYDYIKLNNEFRDLDFRKNLELKTELCKKAEALAEEANVVNAFKELQKLHEEWKELGPVAKEYRESIWERFRAATSVINKKHQAFFETLKKEQKQNLVKKTELCERAEALADEQIENLAAWNKLAKEMEAIQAEWRTIGFASKKDNQKIFDRFRAAGDRFFSKKRGFYAQYKSDMVENLVKKRELCEQAESLSQSEEWNKTTNKMIELQKRWKEIGPVARKQSEAIWNRFKAACDTFFENRAKHLGMGDEKFAENFAAKKTLIEEVKAFTPSESKEKNVAAMREFQSRWDEIGFVPFKEKESIQKEWNDALDLHFADIRSLESEKKLSKFKKMVTGLRNSGKGDRSLRMEREKLIQKYRKTEQDIATLENNIGFFAKSKNVESLVAEIKKKIEQEKEELLRIEEKIKVIDNQF